MRSKIALSVLAFALVAGGGGAWYLCRSPAPPPPAADARPADPQEDSAITASGGLVWRETDRLSLKLQGGEPLILEDRRKCGDLPCPAALASDFHYRGWDERLGGYRLTWRGKDMLIPYSESPQLIEAAQAMPIDSSPQRLPKAQGAGRPDKGLGAWIADIAASRAKAEDALLKASQGKAARQDSALILTLADGRSLTLSDDLACGRIACPAQLMHSFDFAGRSADGRYFGVTEHWDESSAGLLVDSRDGKITELLGKPRFSPAGDRVAAVLADLGSGASRRLEIWSLTGDAPSQDFQITAKDGDDTLYEIAGWADADHLKLRKGSWGDKRRKAVTLSHRDNGWKLE